MCVTLQNVLLLHTPTCTHKISVFHKDVLVSVVTRVTGFSMHRRKCVPVPVIPAPSLYDMKRFGSKNQDISTVARACIHTKLFLSLVDVEMQELCEHHNKHVCTMPHSS